MRTIPAIASMRRQPSFLLPIPASASPQPLDSGSGKLLGRESLPGFSALCPLELLTTPYRGSAYLQGRQPQQHSWQQLQLDFGSGNQRDSFDQKVSKPDIGSRNTKQQQGALDPGSFGSYSERVLTCVASRAVQEMLDARMEINERLGDSATRLWRTLQLYPAGIAVRRFDAVDTEGAFRIHPQTREIEFNLSPFRLLVEEVRKKICDPRERFEIMVEGVRQFVFHEVYHLTRQNFVLHSEAQAISHAASPNFLAMMDLAADIFAAKCGAMVECRKLGDNTESGYLDALYRKLLISLDFWVPRMKAPASKVHKRMRFWGHALMAARILSALDPNADAIDEGLGLDVPLFPIVDFEREQILIFAISPEPVLWIAPTRINLELVQDIISNFERRSAIDTIERTVVILKSVLAAGCLLGTRRVASAG